MKTSKEMQLKIIDKMKENIKRDLPIFDGLYRVIDGEEYILYALWGDSLKIMEHGIYPEVTTINGVEIPKPLTRDELDEVYSSGATLVYYPSASGYLSDAHSPQLAKRNFYEGMLVYKTKEEAIKASKKLFGIEA